MIQTSNPNLFGFNYGSIEGKNCGRLITILDPKLGRGGGTGVIVFDPHYV